MGCPHTGASRCLASGAILTSTSSHCSTLDSRALICASFAAYCIQYSSTEYEHCFNSICICTIAMYTDVHLTSVHVTNICSC
jgi:hypothetical protein